MPFEQLPLDISMEPAATLDNFVVGANGEDLVMPEKNAGIGRTSACLPLG